MAKRCSCFLLLFVLACFTHATAATVNVSLGSVSATAGSTNITIPINVSNLTGLGIIAADLKVNYDPSRLSFVSVSKAGTITANWGSLTYNGNVPGTIKVVIYDVSPVSGSGALVNLIFNAKPQASVGTSALTLEQAQFNDGMQIASIKQNGALTITSSVTQQAQETNLASASTTDTTTSQDGSTSPSYGTTIITQASSQAENLAQVETPATIDSTQQAVSTEVTNQITSEFGSALTPTPSTEVISTVPSPVTVRHPVPLLPSTTVTSKMGGGTAVSTSSTIAATQDVIVITSTLVNDFLLWKSFRLEAVSTQPRPIRWKIINKATLPYFLFLDESKGVIQGIAWGKKSVSIPFRITLPDGTTQKAMCNLEIR